MKTTEQWWQEVSACPNKFNEWLKKQYYGEVQACVRIRKMSEIFKLSPIQRSVIRKIANDEATHAAWIKGLMIQRGIAVSDLDRGTDRYWAEVLEYDMSVYSFEELCAIGHHAEEMRLDRIAVLMRQSGYPDVADVFDKIWRDEVFHADAFKAMSTEQHLVRFKGAHEEGKVALGLVS